MLWTFTLVVVLSWKYLVLLSMQFGKLIKFGIVIPLDGDLTTQLKLVFFVGYTFLYIWIFLSLLFNMFRLASSFSSKNCGDLSVDFDMWLLKYGQSVVYLDARSEALILIIVMVTGK